MSKSKMKETEADKEVTRKALENSGATLLAHIEGIEELQERADEIKVLISGRYAAAKSDGYDKKAVKAVIKRRSMSQEQIEGARALSMVVDTYLLALDEAEGVA